MDDYPEQGDQFEIATLIRRMASISDVTMRRRQLQRHVLSVDAATFAAHLAHIVSHAIRGQAIAAELLLSVCEYIHRAEGRDAIALEAVNLEAKATRHHALCWMLLRPEPYRSVEKLILRQKGRPMTLGERKAVAVGWDPTKLERLINDNDPAVVEKLCKNPRIQEQHILAIAARRPTLPILLDVVLREPRWGRRAIVRETLLQNPYIDTGTALCYLPTLPATALERIQCATELHPAVLDFSRYLLAARYGDVQDAEVPDYSQVKRREFAPIDEVAWDGSEI